MNSTPRLELPFIVAGQAQKEVAHNEALQILDIMVSASVEAGPQTIPPAAPAPGACFIVGPGAEGEWVGKDHCLAAWTSGGWRFARAREGTMAFVQRDGVTATFRLGAWEVGPLRASKLLVGGRQVVGERAGKIPSPAGGGVVDSEARTTLDRILAALRDHGLIEV